MSIDLMPGFGAFTQTVSVPLLIDSLSLTPAVAYSTRRLRAAYAGSALQVRRSSDNATQNIGFTSAGDLDTAALASFVGANSGFVSIWYDQSTNGNNATQGTAGNQPRIVSSGTIDLVNAKASLYFSFDISADMGLVTGTSIAVSGGSASLAAVAERTTRAGSRSFCGGSAGCFQSRYNGDHTATNLRRAEAGLFTTTGTAPLGVNVVQSVSTTSSQIIRFNATEESNTTSPAFTANTDYIGTSGSSGNEVMDGLMPEVLIFTAVNDATVRANIQSNMKLYWGTP